MPASVEMVVGKGLLEPADDRAVQALREKGLGLGEVIHVKIERHRNPRFMRKAHAIGRLCRENIAGFESLNDHQALKRLQYESGVSCDTMVANVPGVGPVEVRMPKSISFADMDDAEFSELVSGITYHIASHYWPDMEPEKIERMADLIE